MKNPVELLEEEHELLFHAINVGEKIQKINEDKVYHSLLHDFILFMRNYTEIYHFPKEEDILYPVLRNRSKNMTQEFIHEICDNHDDFKHYIAQIENLFIDRDHRTLRRVMERYLSELGEHLNRENQVILSVATSLLSESEKENLSQEFEALDLKNRDKNSLKKNLNEISIKIG